MLCLDHGEFGYLRGSKGNPAILLVAEYLLGPGPLVIHLCISPYCVQRTNELTTRVWTESELTCHGPMAEVGDARGQFFRPAILASLAVA